jgi:hypothetical protein
VTRRDKKVARACATVRDRQIFVEQFDTIVEAGWVHDKAPIEAQVAATLAAFTLSDLKPRAGVAD